VKYLVQQQDDPFWTSVTDPYDRQAVRWTYRQLRRNGVRRSTARTAIHGIFHVGIRAQINRRAASR